MSKKKKDNLEEQDSAIQETPNEEVPAEDGGKEPCPSGEDEFDVSPKIEAEYLVVMLDCKLKDHQDVGEDKILTDPVYIGFSIKQKEGTPKFDKGAKLEITGDGEIELYKEKELTTKVDITTPFTNEEMLGEEKLKLWAFGKKAGKCTLKLTVEDTEIEELTIADPLEIEIGVIELKMKVHEHDKTELAKIEVDPATDPIDTYYTNLKDQALPGQKELSEEEKVKKGRLVHVQKDKNHGRAKVVLTKLDANNCPTGSDDYDIVLNEKNTSGSLEVFDSEFDGNLIAFPVKLKLSDLKNADKTYWVQGKTATKKWRDARIDLGIDRAEGGAEKTEKRNGDWSRFSMVMIKEVKVDYTPEANRASAWDDTNKRFYNNLKADWDSTNKKFTTDASTDENSRKITIGATLSEKLQGVKIHFILAPHKDNRKAANWGEDMPSTWKWKDIYSKFKHKDKDESKIAVSDRGKLASKEFLHLSATTDANGYAKKELVLSRFGGDVFTPGCYIDEDPHLAKYVHGHSDLEKKEPVLATDNFKVWRKFWYQFTKADGFNPPLPATAVTAYEDIWTRMERDQTLSFIETATGTAGEKVAPVRTFYKKYIVDGGNSEDKVANVGDYNKNAIADACYEPKSDQPVKNQLIICSYQYDERYRGNRRKAIGQSAAITSDIHGTKIKITLSNPVFDPPLQGGSMVTELYWYRHSSPGTKNNIPAAKASIPKPRANNQEIQVEVPVINPVPAAGNSSVYIVAKCWSPWGPYLGESFGKHSLIVYDPSDVADYNDTVVHEIGHAFNQTPRPGTQPSAGSGIPDHPNQADRGQGNHCQVNDGVDATSGDTKYKCVMYDSGPMQWGLHRYCKTCHPYLLIENFTKFK